MRNPQECTHALVQHVRVHAHAHACTGAAFVRSSSLLVVVDLRDGSVGLVASGGGDTFLCACYLQNAHITRLQEKYVISARQCNVATVVPVPEQRTYL